MKIKAYGLFSSPPSTTTRAATEASTSAAMEGSSIRKKRNQGSLLSWVKTTSSAKRKAVCTSPPPSACSKSYVQGPDGLLSLDEESHVLYLPGLLKEEGEARSLFSRIRGEVEWLQRDVTVFGRTTPQRRLVSYQSCREPHLPPYRYSGLELVPGTAKGAVLEVLGRVEQAAAERCDVVVARSSPPPPPPRLFNSCLLNLYRDGRDCMGWHADDEGVLIGSSHKEVVIASASFGTARDFYLRPKPSKNSNSNSRQQRRRKVRYSLGDGDVLFMLGKTQSNWHHSVPERANVPGERINLTFRWHVGCGGEAPRVLCKKS